MIRRALALLLLGLLLGLGRGGLAAWRGEVLEVTVAEGDSVDAAILVDQGIRAGWLRTDPVIRQRLEANLRFAGQEGEPQALVDQGIALDLAATDPVIRRRLIQRARWVLEGRSERTLTQARPEMLDQPVYRVRVVPVDSQGQVRVIAAMPGEVAGTDARLHGVIGLEAAASAVQLEVGETITTWSTYGWLQLTLLERRVPSTEEVAEAAPLPGVEVGYDARMAELRARYRVVRR